MRERARARKFVMPNIYLRQSRGRKNCLKERRDVGDFRMSSRAALSSPRCCVYRINLFPGSNYKAPAITQEREFDIISCPPIQLYLYRKSTHTDFPAISDVRISLFRCLSCLCCSALPADFPSPTSWLFIRIQSDIA